MQKSYNKAMIMNTFLTEDFLLPDVQALDELDIFDDVLPGEYTHHASEQDEWLEQHPRELETYKSWTRH